MNSIVLFAGVLLAVHMADGFGFGGGAGGCGCAPPPPPPACPPPQPCGCGRRRRDAVSAVNGNAESTLCSSEKLRQIMRDNISGSTGDSKSAIQKATLSKLTGTYDVICAKGELSYTVSNSKDFCQETVEGVTCYAYLKL